MNFSKNLIMLAIGMSISHHTIIHYSNDMFDTMLHYMKNVSDIFSGKDPCKITILQAHSSHSVDIDNARIFSDRTLKNCYDIDSYVNIIRDIKAGMVEDFKNVTVFFSIFYSIRLKMILKADLKQILNISPMY